MKIKEIAEITGNTERSIRLWIDKLQSVTISEKISDAYKTKVPADFTLEETIEIIRAGGNNTLAELLLENAKNKNAVSTVVNNSDIEKAIQFLYHEIKQLKENKVKQIEAPKREHPEIFKNYELHGRKAMLVIYKKVKYQVLPNFYIDKKFDLRYNDREYGSLIKQGFLSLDQLFKYMEKNL